MAAAKLVTRCPACRTAFRLVADQLRLRQGLVRCGQCDTVFDAREHLIEVPAPAAASAKASTPATPTAPAAPAVTMAAALAHAEQTQATARAREDDTPFQPGFDPGYEVPALDSPTTMMSEPSPDEEAPVQETSVASVAGNITGEDRQDAAAEDRVNAEAAEAIADVGTASPEISPEPEPEPDVGHAVAPETAEAAAIETEAPQSNVELVSEASTPASADTAPEAETPLTEPPLPWPTLNHSAFDDEPMLAPQSTAPDASHASQASHSSLDPAAAFAPKNPSGMPPYGAYSAKAS